jgi:DNA-binding transcriptional LysR family regulator
VARHTAVPRAEGFASPELLDEDGIRLAFRMSVQALAAFVVVAEELHFARASRRLGVHQSTTTRLVKQLEAQLRCPLFTRTTRRVQLTPDGQRLVGAARQVISALGDVDSQAGLRRTVGVVRLS